MISLSNCLTTSVLSLLRKNNKQIINAYTTTTGKKRPIQPAYLEEINVQLNIISSDTSDEELGDVLADTISTFSPVIKMLKEDIRVNVDYVIHKPNELQINIVEEK